MMRQRRRRGGKEEEKKGGGRRVASGERKIKWHGEGGTQRGCVRMQLKNKCVKMEAVPGSCTHQGRGVVGKRRYGHGERGRGALAGHYVIHKPEEGGGRVTRGAQFLLAAASSPTPSRDKVRKKSPPPHPSTSLSGRSEKQITNAEWLADVNRGGTGASTSGSDDGHVHFSSAGPSLPSLEDIAKNGEHKFDGRQKRRLAEEYLDVDFTSSNNIGKSIGKKETMDETAHSHGKDPVFEKGRRRAKRILLDLMSSGEDFEQVFVEYSTAGVIDEMLAIAISARLRTAIADHDVEVEELLALLLQRVMYHIATESASPSMRLINELLSERYMKDDEASKHIVRRRIGIRDDGRLQFRTALSFGERDGNGIVGGRDVIGMAINISSRRAYGRSTSVAVNDYKTSEAPERLEQNYKDPRNKVSETNYVNHEYLNVQEFIDSIDEILSEASSESESYMNTHAATLARLQQIKNWVIEMCRGGAP